VLRNPIFVLTDPPVVVPDAAVLLGDAAVGPPDPPVVLPDVGVVLRGRPLSRSGADVDIAGSHLVCREAVSVLLDPYCAPSDPHSIPPGGSGASPGRGAVLAEATRGVD